MSLEELSKLILATFLLFRHVLFYTVLKWISLLLFRKAEICEMLQAHLTIPFICKLYEMRERKRALKLTRFRHIGLLFPFEMKSSNEMPLTFFVHSYRQSIYNLERQLRYKAKIFYSTNGRKWFLWHVSYKKLNIFKHIAMKKQIVVAKLTRF